jgi:hypothetical protein
LNEKQVPVILRKGLPKRCDVNVERYKDVGEELPKASDHCKKFILN